MELNNLTRWHTLKEILQLLVPRGYLHFFTSRLIKTFSVCTKYEENVSKGVLNSTFFSIWLVFNRAFIESGQGWSVSLSRGLLEVDIESRCLQILPFVYFLDKGHCQRSLRFWHGHGLKYSFLCLPCVLNVGAVLQIQNQIGLDVISLLHSHQITLNEVSDESKHSFRLPFNFARLNLCYSQEICIKPLLQEM